MKYKKTLLIICLIVCLISIASVSAADTGSFASADEGSLALADEGSLALADDSSLALADDTSVIATDDANSIGDLKNTNPKGNLKENSDLNENLKENSDLNENLKENSDLNENLKENAKSNENLKENADSSESLDENVDLNENLKNSIIAYSKEKLNSKEDEKTSEENISYEDDGTFTALQFKIDTAEDGSTIILDKDYTYNKGFSKLGIRIDKDLTIDGNGHTINGLSQSRIFLIKLSLVKNHKVVLKNIKIINGNTSLYGGAIFNYGNLTVKNCTFTNNYAKYCGGAINSVGHLYLENSKFNKNTAGGDGGAVLTFSIEKNIEFLNKFYKNESAEGDISFIIEANFNMELKFGTDHMKNCTFTNNIAKGRGGGAIYGFTHLDINSCTFKSNQAKDKGAAVFANKNLNLKNSKFTSHKVSKYGGAVYFKCHELSQNYVNGSWVSVTKYYSANITNCAFTKNSAKKGGAIYSFLDSDADKKRLKVKKCTFTDNSASSGRDVFGGTCSNCVYNYIKLSSKNITVKKTAKKFTLSVKLTKGKTLLKNKKVSFKFKGKTYTAKTNSKGIAKVVIKKAVIKKLKAGSKYTVTISYLKNSIKTTVKVKK